MDMKRFDDKKINVRLPRIIFSRLLDSQKKRPYMSLNALIVEAVEKALKKEEVKA
jgi:predicted HicB family RNase H-like nuclease